MTQGKRYDLELETYTTKGRLIDIRTTGVVTMENNTPVKLIGIFQDISEQKANQRRLEKSNATQY
ncbi:MAG: PAS domain-containing protein [Arenicella sp.]|jgi:PAS domain-containing protein